MIDVRDRTSLDGGKREEKWSSKVAPWLRAMASLRKLEKAKKGMDIWDESILENEEDGLRSKRWKSRI